ncbi:MAG: TerB family tellurite resistance protein, partial [Pseudomonadota bacterium]
MLNKLMSLFSNDQAETADGVPGHPPEAPAVAALMIEAGGIDGELDPNEKNRIIRLLAERFSLDTATASTLFARAEAAHADTEQLLGFTRTIKDKMNAEERIELIELMWEVVYADGEVHDYEAQLMRRLAGLIYVEDRESGRARQRVLEKMGLDR